MSQPRKQVKELNPEILKVSNRIINRTEINPALKCTVKTGYRLFVTDTVCGRTTYEKGWITVPKWAYDRGKDYFTYYVAHELAHAFAYERYGNVVTHGKEFYDFFNILCPKVHQHFEFDYKPNAKRFSVKSK